MSRTFLTVYDIRDYLATLPRTEVASREMATQRGHGHRLRPLEALRLLLASAVNNSVIGAGGSGDSEMRSRGVYLRMKMEAAREIWEAAQLEGTFQEWYDALEKVDLRPFKEAK